MITVLAWMLATEAASESIPAKVNYRKTNHIRITADTLIAEVDAGEIEFVGNVKATQAESVITADRLKILYDPETFKINTSEEKTKSIEKIIATGHVRIVYDNIIAETDKAEYTIISDVLVLTGEQSKIIQKGHSIAGRKFTLHRSDGKLIVESSEKTRVKAIYDPLETDK